MIEKAQKLKIGVAYLLLFSFLNLMTFLPGGNFHYSEHVTQGHSLNPSHPDDLNRSTVFELILENVAGLTDYLPGSEKSDFSYHFFNLKRRAPNSSFAKDISAPHSTKKQFALHTSAIPIEDPRSLPLLQSHNFIFRLTPF
ncbi:MAG: hypothetical protein JST63_07435 [Bacteroidetes bacterium]|nr:hypothetical protein [Bacteroidota bacterium]